MSKSHRLINAANPKNLKPIEHQLKSMADQSDVYPTNKAYLTPQQQSTVK